VIIAIIGAYCPKLRIKKEESGGFLHRRVKMTRKVVFWIEIDVCKESHVWQNCTKSYYLEPKEDEHPE
jgi:hypothetical protein